MRSKTAKTTLGIAILVVMAVFGLSLSAYAFSGEMSGTALLFTYYDVRSKAEGGLGLTKNYHTVTNVSSNWVQAHVRVRTGKRSVELLDFDVLMSPKDVFTFELLENPLKNGSLSFLSCDRETLLDSGFTLNFARDPNRPLDCVLIDNDNFPQTTSLIMTCEGVNEATAINEAKVGYVEVIGEGIVIPSPTNKDRCRSNAGVTIPGKTLLNTSASRSLSTLCPQDVFAMNNDPRTASTGELNGRIFYSNVITRLGVTKLASLNAEVLDFQLPGIGTGPPLPILHYESYGKEQLSPKCGAGESAATPCYAYVAASTSPPANGANDLNWCFYRGTAVNKYGAGATWGPTLPDLAVRRDGTIAKTATALNTLLQNMSRGYITSDGFISGSVFPKVSADTHYFAAPAPKYPQDTLSGFSFTFPLQHFIGEREIISIEAIYDLDERVQTITEGKFISPGLPTPQSPAEESRVYFIKDPPFIEGWIRFKPVAINGTGTCTGLPPGACAVKGYSPTTFTLVAPGTNYVPAYTAATFINGANEITATHFQYSSAIPRPGQ